VCVSSCLLGRVDVGVRLSTEELGWSARYEGRMALHTLRECRALLTLAVGAESAQSGVGLFRVKYSSPSRFITVILHFDRMITSTE
jgi:hypothetical protein